MHEPGDQIASRGSPYWPAQAAGRLLAVACVTAVVFSAVMLLTYPFGRDQGIFAVIGEGLVQGKAPYLDLWDVKTPGIYFLFAAADACFGHHMIGPRILEALGLLVTSLAMIDLGRRLFDDVRIGYLAAAIGAIMHQQLEFWHTCQPETFGGMCFLWATWLATYKKERPGALREVLLGVLWGAVILLKPHLGLVMPWIVGFALGRPTVATWRTHARKWSVVACGTTAVLAITGFWLALVGAIEQAVWTWWQFAPGYSSVGFNASYAAYQAGYYDSLVTLLMQMSGLAGIGVLLFLTLAPRRTAGYAKFWWLMGALGLMAAVVLMQHKGFKYHYSAAFPLLAMAAAAGWGELWKLAEARAWRYCPAFFCALGAAYFSRFPVSDLQGTPHERIARRLEQAVSSDAARRRVGGGLSLDSVRQNFDLDNLRDVAMWVRANTSTTDSVLLWGCDALLYWLSERRPATRYIHNIAQRSPWKMAEAREQFLQEVVESAPALVVVQHGDVITPVTGQREDSAGTLPQFPELARYLKASFRRAIVIGKFDVYERVR